jgi:hypothetical protein
MGSHPVSNLPPEALVRELRIKAFRDENSVREFIYRCWRGCDQAGFLRGWEAKPELGAEIVQEPLGRRMLHVFCRLTGQRSAAWPAHEEV